MIKGIPASTTNEIVSEKKMNLQEKGRGYRVYNATELVGTTARTKTGHLLNVTYEHEIFGLTIDERIEIFEKCADVFGVVTGRIFKMSALDWAIIPDDKNEDKIYQKLKDYKSLYDEYITYNDIKYRIAAKVFGNKILSILTDCLPDLSNFQKSLSRWRRNIRSKKYDKTKEIEDFLYSPNSSDSWEDFVKQYIFDLLVHGTCGIYKEIGKNSNILENFYILNGGTIIPIRTRYVSGLSAYLQMAIDIEPALYFQDEISFSRYIPSSDFAYGKIPLNALVNKVAESLLFDEFMAEQADGTKPPEKLVVFGDNSPFGTMGDDLGSLPLDATEQQRIETAVNEKRKQAIRTISGIGHPLVLDLSRSDTMGVQNERQKLIRQTVGLVYNVSNMELNMTDSDGVSGRANGEVLEGVDQNKAVLPLARILEYALCRDIVPLRFGSGYNFEFKISVNPAEELAYQRNMVESGLYSQNEVRTGEIGIDPVDDPCFDKPKSLVSENGMSENNLSI